MSNKLIALGVAFLFISGTWAYFQTPEPPIAGLVRPQIDEKLFEGGVGNAAAKQRTDMRTQRLEQRKNIRGDQEDSAQKEGFFSKLLHREKNPDKGGAALVPRALPGAAARLKNRDAGVNNNKRDFLAKRREDRKAKREAMLNAAKSHTSSLKAVTGANPPDSSGEMGVDEQVPDEPPPTEPEIEEPPPEHGLGVPYHEDAPPEE